MPIYSFKRNERLRGRKNFAELFDKGKVFTLSPFRITWMIVTGKDHKFPLQAAFVVPKRNFKKASDRNRIRRRMKEAYRLHKNELKEIMGASGKQLVFTCVYSGREESLYPEIENKIIVTLQRLAKETSGLSAIPVMQP